MRKTLKFQPVSNKYNLLEIKLPKICSALEARDTEQNISSKFKLNEIKVGIANFVHVFCWMQTI